MNLPELNNLAKSQKEVFESVRPVVTAHPEVGREHLVKQDRGPQATTPSPLRSRQSSRMRLSVSTMVWMRTRRFWLIPNPPTSKKLMQESLTLLGTDKLDRLHDINDKAGKAWSDWGRT